MTGQYYNGSIPTKGDTAYPKNTFQFRSEYRHRTF